MRAAGVTWHLVTETLYGLWDRYATERHPDGWFEEQEQHIRYRQDQP